MRLKLFKSIILASACIITGYGFLIAQQAPDVSLNIYIDASGSMKGYVGENSEYSLFISKFRDFLNNYHDMFFYQSGGGIVQISQQQFNNMASNAALYNSDETNLVHLFKYATLNDNSIVNILITDGVLSCNGNEAITKGFDFNALTQVLQPIIQQNTVFFVLGIKSSFNGIIYSEFKHGDIKFPWNGRRPFFVFLWGKNETNVSKCVMRMDKEFRKFVSDSGLINSLPHDIIKCIKRIDKKFRPFADNSGLINTPLSDNDYRILQLSPLKIPTVNINLNSLKNIIKDNQEPPRMIFMKSYNTNNPTQIILSNDGPVESVERPFNLEFKYSTKGQEYYPEIYKLATDSSNYYTFETNREMIIIKFNEKFINFFNFREIDTFPPIVFNLQRIQDVTVWEDWSTLNDSVPENASRIYYLSKVLSTILEIAVKDSPPTMNIVTYKIIFRR